MSNKPQLSVTIKFRGVTIEGMTVEELRELRNVLNELVGDKDYVPVPYPQPYPVYPWNPYQQVWITCSDNTNKLNLDGTTAGSWQVYTGDTSGLILGGAN